jgi:RNase P/RNase MRP subunit p29
MLKKKHYEKVGEDFEQVHENYRNSSGVCGRVVEEAEKLLFLRNRVGIITASSFYL